MVSCSCEKTICSQSCAPREAERENKGEIERDVQRDRKRRRESEGETWHRKQSIKPIRTSQQLLDPSPTPKSHHLCRSIDQRRETGGRKEETETFHFKPQIPSPASETCSLWGRDPWLFVRHRSHWGAGFHTCSLIVHTCAQIFGLFLVYVMPSPSSMRVMLFYANINSLGSSNLD